MGNIFTIFLRIFPFLIFIFLEVISFYTISQYNEFYQSNIVSRSNSLVGGLYKEVSDYQNYFSLKESNESLVAENADLRKKLFLAQGQLSQITDDSLYARPSAVLPNHYEIFYAKVISNSIANLRNYILINKGSKHGITKDMAVMNDKGPIGIVIEVTDNYSCVMSFINKDAIFSARVKGTEYVGQLKWNGGDVRMAILDEIPKHIKLKKGDEIVTSGFSTYFPEGIPIGKVVEQRNDKLNNFASIKVLLYNDFTSLQHVYLIKNSNQPEIKGLEDKMKGLQTNTTNE